MRGLAHHIVLVDEAGRVAEGKALDIAQALPVEGVTVRLEGTDDLRRAADADVVVVADRHREAGRAEEWEGDAGLALLRTVHRLVPGAVFVCAGVRQLGLVEAAVSEAGIARRRILGSAPEALRAAALAATAAEAHVPPDEVAMTLVGRPPTSIIVPWDEASVAGRLATSVLTVAALARLDAQLARLWPPGPMTLGAAAARLIDAVYTGVPRTVSAYVIPDPLDVPRTRGIVLPVTVQRDGIGPVALPRLSPRDRVRLDTALER